MYIGIQSKLKRQKKIKKIVKNKLHFIKRDLTNISMRATIIIKG